MHYPVLSRGLNIIEILLLRPRGCRFGEFKQKLDIGDASLHRLLQSLLELGWIRSEKKGHYSLGPQVHNILKQWLFNPIQGEMQDILKELSENSGQSSAWCSLEGNTMTIKAHHQITDSIVVVRRGETLHPEIDHAGALAILSQCSPQKQADLITGKGSTIESLTHLQKSMKACFKKKVFLDLSKQRHGISRMAVPIDISGQTHCIFICGLSVSIRERKILCEHHLLRALERAKQIPHSIDVQNQSQEIHL